MHSRWYHPPKLHSPAAGHTKKVAWLELFYDLIYVASIIQLGNGLSANPGLGGFLAFAALFTPLWLAWTSFTFYMNRFSVDDFPHRGLVFVQMFAVGAVAIAVPQVMLKGETFAFAISFGVVRLTMCLLYARSYTAKKEAGQLSRWWTMLFGIEAAIWFVSAFLPKPWVWIAWAIAVGIAFSIPLSRYSRELAWKYPSDLVHFTERYGLLVIIVLGESFVKVLSELAASGSGLDVYLMACAAMLVTCALWWLYFDDVAGSRIKTTRGATWVWIYTHLPLTMSITAVGVAVKKVATLDPGLPAPTTKYYWLLCGTLALALLSVAAIDAVTERRQSEVSDRTTVTVRVASALAILLVPIATGMLAAWVFIALVLAFCLGQVFIDMILAPDAMDADELHHAEHREVATRLAMRRDSEVDLHGDDEGHDEGHDKGGLRLPGKRIRRDLSTTVRRGAPNEVRRDFYFFIIEGSWTRFFATVAVTYVFINIVFASLYLLEPGSVAGVEEGNFAQAFYFSVQTMSTIGYGGMLPLTDYGNVIMTVEAVTGMLVVALSTGLMFAKASRPRSSVLFADSVVINLHDGQPTLMLRAANGRGNEVVEATVTVSALLTEHTPEGHSMRRIYDLPLERNMSPLFAMSWTIMHKIDEHSPIAGCRWGEEGGLLSLVVTMLGHDSTYGQTTHARHIYYPQDIRVGHTFEDVIFELDDGRLLIDYAKFNDTVVQPESTAELARWQKDHAGATGADGHDHGTGDGADADAVADGLALEVVAEAQQSEAMQSEAQPAEDDVSAGAADDPKA